MPVSTLNGRLACACNCAYYVQTAGPLATPATDPYLAGAGFEGTPTGIVSGPDAINASVVGQLGQECVVVAFRGTLPPTLDVATLNGIGHEFQVVLDWLQDFTSDLSRFPWLQTLDPGAMIHTGIGCAFETLWTATKAELQTILDSASTPKRVVFTGHSKGGALAALAAMRWNLEERASSTVVTFAAPRVANMGFAESYGSAPIQHERFEFADDLVPHVPSSMDGVVYRLSQIPFIGTQFADLVKYDYASLGVLRFIDWDGNVLPDSTELEITRGLSLAEKIVRLQLPLVAMSHRIALTGSDFGYLKAVAPTGMEP